MTMNVFLEHITAAFMLVQTLMAISPAHVRSVTKEHTQTARVSTVDATIEGMRLEFPKLLLYNTINTGSLELHPVQTIPSIMTNNKRRGCFVYI